MGFMRTLKARSNKIISKLFITYFIAIFLAIASIGITSYHYASKSIESKVSNASVEVVAQIQKNIDLNLTQIRTTILTPYYNESLMSGLENYDDMGEAERASYERMLYDFFSRSYFVPKRPDFVGGYMFDKDGKPMFASKRTEPGKLDELYREGEWLKKTVEADGRVYFEGAYKDVVGGEDRMLFSASLLVKSTGMVGVVKAEYDFGAITDLFKDYNMGKGSKLVIVDREGKVVYSTDPADKANASFSGDVNARLTKEKDDLWMDVDGDNVFVAYNALKLADWTVVSLVPKNEVFDASIQIRNATLIVGLVALAAMSIISVMFASWITKPILKLLKSFERVKQGNLDERIDIRRGDEIGKIARNFNAMVGQIDHLIKYEYINQIKLKEAEISFLQSQINPHFLYNTLYTIKAKADYHGAPDISRMVNSLADMFRYSVKNPNGFVTVEREVENIADYLTIQKERFGDKIGYEIRIDEETRKRTILKLILQPLVENAAFHGLERKKGKGLLTVSGTVEEGDLIFEVADDGVGMAEEDLERLRGTLRESENVTGGQSNIGLINVHTRLVLCYGSEAGLRIESRRDEGTRVTFRIPGGHADADYHQDEVKRDA